MVPASSALLVTLPSVRHLPLSCRQRALSLFCCQHALCHSSAVSTALTGEPSRPRIFSGRACRK